MLSNWQKRFEKIPGFTFCMRHAELIRYIVVGGATTCVNFAVWFLLSRVLFADLYARNEALWLMVFNWIAWGAAVIFAFFMNDRFVFRARSSGVALLLRFASFVLLRLGSGVLENTLPSLLVLHLSFYDLIAKVLVSVLIILLNYLFTKFITFRKRRKVPMPDQTPAVSDSEEPSQPS